MANCDYSTFWMQSQSPSKLSQKQPQITPILADKKSANIRVNLRPKFRTMKPSDFRRIALGLPEAVEASHFGNPDFRVGGKIFATLSLAKQGYGVLLLTPEQQEGMVEDEPKIFSPIPNAWGKQGATRVNLANVSRDILKAALQTAWRRKAPKRLLTTPSK